MRLHSITSRFIATLVVSTTLPFAVFGWFVISGMRDRVEGRVVSAYLPDKAASAAREIETRIRQIDEACQLVLMAAHDQLGEGTLFDRNRFAQFVELGPLLEGNADLVLLANHSGEVLYSTLGFGRADPRVGDDLIPRNVAGAQWFDALYLGDGGGKVWLPWARSPYLHRNPDHQSRDPSDYSFGVAYRLGSGDVFGGALLVLVSCSRIQALLDETHEFLRQKAGLPSAEVFLMDSAGRTIAHTNRERYGQPLEPVELQQAVGGSTEPSGEVAFSAGDGTDRMAGFARVSARAPAEGAWWIGLQADRDELFSTSSDFSRVLVVAIAVTAVILMLWSLIASRAILRPVRRLVAATGEVASGDLSARVPASGRHELADLGRAFNSMTEQLAASRESLKQAERQAAWAEMARQVAHEIKNPLTPMRMAAQLLLKSRRDQDPRAEQLAERLGRMVVEQTEVLDRIASDFRHFAGAPERQVERFGADELMGELFDGVRTVVESPDVEIQFVPNAKGAVVEGDRHELQRVFLNLVTNAVDAGGGTASIRWSTAIEPPPTPDNNGHPGRLVVQLEDGGPGIPDEVRARLFEPYFTTKSSGTGLGLAICRRIIEAHGGSIGVAASDPGHTVFRLELPLLRPDRPADDLSAAT